MAYTDKNYFLKKIKEDDLKELIKDEAGVPQDMYLEEAIASADNLINGYIKSTVDAIPLAEPVPSMIKQCSYYIATYMLHDRIQYNDIPERVKDNYDLAINYLKDIESGKITLNLEIGKTSAGISYFVDDNIFDRGTF